MEWLSTVATNVLDPTKWSTALIALTGSPWFWVVAVGGTTLLLVYIILNSEASKAFFSRKKAD